MSCEPACGRRSGLPKGWKGRGPDLQCKGLQGPGLTPIRRITGPPTAPPARSLESWVGPFDTLAFCVAIG